MKKLLFIWALLPLLLLAQDTWVNIEFEFDGYAASCLPVIKEK